MRKEPLTYDYIIARRTYISILIITFVWCLLIFATPILWNAGGLLSKASSFIYYAFSTTCHQLDSRSFHIFGVKLGVCSRCTSIYIAFLIGSIVYPLFKRIDSTKLPSLWFLLIATGLLFADSAMEIFKFQDNTFISRSVTGFILGFTLPFYLIPGFVNFVQEVVSFFKDSYDKKKA